MVIGILQFSFSQTITSGQPIEHYIEDVLIGSGITVSNITITPAGGVAGTGDNVIGEFTNFGVVNLGLDHGIVVSTGSVNNITEDVGVNASDNLEGSGDPDLAQINPGLSIHDAVVIEFDFVPLDDNIEFRYVFASEEFPEFASGSYNDVFGFFISGPGIDGPYSNDAENIALIPGTSTEITVSEIYDNGNGTYYNENNNNPFVYDGFTDLFTAQSTVVPCETYHIKLAIADKGDGAFNSAFFLEAYSFSANAPSFDLEFSHVIDSTENALLEGCTSVDVIFEIPEAFDEQTSYPISFLGTATLDEDYSVSPTNNAVVFEPGSTTSVITIDPLIDNLTEGVETIIMSLDSVIPCGGGDSILFKIYDYAPVVPSISLSDSALCDQNDNITVTFTGNVNSGDVATWSLGDATIVTGTPNTNGDPFVLAWDTYGSKAIGLSIQTPYDCPIPPYIAKNITVKPTPSCDFTILSDICAGDTTSVVYDNDNDTPIGCSGALHWSFGSDISVISPSNPCERLVTSEVPGNHGINLYVTENGCTSEICYDTLIVVPSETEDCCIDPETFAGNDTSVCGFDYVLNATLESSSHYGYWTQEGGSVVATFVSASAQGNVGQEGSPQAHIQVSTPGTVILRWHEINGECSGFDDVQITFTAQPNVTFIGETMACGNQIQIEADGSVGVTGSLSYQWTESYDNIEILGANSNNATVVLQDDNYGTYTLACTVSSGNCYDVSFIDVTFVEEYPADAGQNATQCGLIASLDASDEYGGYWSVKQEPAGCVNCAATFSPDIYDPNAEVTVTQLGEWQFRWTVENPINQDCVTHDDVTYTFEQNTIPIEFGDIPPTCLDSLVLNVDTSGHGDGIWFWEVDPTWEHKNEVNILFNPYDPHAVVKRDFRGNVYGDSAHVDIPMRLTFRGTCFYQAPEPNLGNDTINCGLQKEMSVMRTLPAGIGIGEWSVVSNAAQVSPTEGYSTEVQANEESHCYIVFTESNNLIVGSGSNQTSMALRPGCRVKDTVDVHFLEVPVANAGDEVHICGGSVQLNASLDATISSSGTWIPNTGAGQYGFSEDASEPNTAAMAEEDAWFHHIINSETGYDKVFLSWKVYNTVSAQCYSIDSVPIHFWAKAQNLGITLNNDTAATLDSVCDKKYFNLLGSPVAGNSNAQGTWISADGSPITWGENNSGLHNVQPGFAGISTFDGAANVTKEIYWRVVNGINYGVDGAPVCTETTRHVFLRYDQNVTADISEGDSIGVCGDTIYLSNSTVEDWAHYQWFPTDDYSYFTYGSDNLEADTLPGTYIVAGAAIYPDADTIPGGDTHNIIKLKAYNGLCGRFSTINSKKRSFCRLR